MLRVENTCLKINMEPGRLINFDHIVFWVANAKTSASYYITRMGFQPLAIKEPSEDNPFLSYAIRQDKVTFVFQSATSDDFNHSVAFEKQLKYHGDFLKDVAFEVSNLAELLQHAKSKGAEVIKDLHEETDEDGVIRKAVLKTFGDNTHTLIDRSQYNGDFAPGYTKVDPDPINELLPPAKIEYIDHIESDLIEGTNDDTLAWYENVLRMNRFWCVDYETNWKPWSNINHLSVANDEKIFVLSMKESANQNKNNHAKAFVKAFHGSGVEHVALYTDDIVTTIRNLRARGADLVQWPPTYYDIIRERLKNSSVEVEESIDSLEELSILIDYDEEGYMLQTFTKHIQARPTLFIEILQRRNGHRGFGAGNYKMLAEAIEMLERIS